MQCSSLALVPIIPISTALTLGILDPLSTAAEYVANLETNPGNSFPHSRFIRNESTKWALLPVCVAQFVWNGKCSENAFKAVFVGHRYVPTRTIAHMTVFDVLVMVSGRCCQL